jgi:flagellar basal-body rod protein FlgF
MQSLDLVANNIANASTGGYKADSEFYTVFSSAAANEDAIDAPSTAPMIQRQWTDFSQGLLQPTNNPLDLGLSGKGFFVVQGPSGPLYTRNGSFHAATDGTLVTADGHPLLGQSGQPITTDSKQPVEITQDGSVRQNGQQLAQIKLVDFRDPRVLAKQANNYFLNTSSEDPTASTGVQVYQGKIESSNVSAAQGAVRLVGVMRQFEMMQKAITVASDMSNKAITEVARV